MKELLDCFDYIKRYQVDILDSLYILLEILILKMQGEDRALLLKAQKRKKIHQDFIQALSQTLHPIIVPNPKLNLAKIFKSLQDVPLTPKSLSHFLDVITQKKTQNKLYFYAMPLEIQELILSLLEIKKGESLYYPCYGLGSLFLQIFEGVAIYGEELDERFAQIARLLCRLFGLDGRFLLSNDILKRSSFKTPQGGFRHFDVIICNPPVHSHMGTRYIAEDERFGGVLSKNYPELTFFSHALVHFNHRAIFLLRSQIFKNSALESKLKTALQGKLECIIELPKNLFPYQNHDFVLVVLKKGSQEILSIDATEFYFKEGRYNRLSNQEEILRLYAQKASSKHSKILKNLDELFGGPTLLSSQQKLGEIVDLIRGQRVYGSNKDEEVRYYEIGVSDFAPLGYTQDFHNLRISGNVEKITRYALKPFDLLIALRGSTPKITLLPPMLPRRCVANVGVLTLRAKDALQAKGLYVYFFSKEGERALQEICNGGLDLQKLCELPLPHDLEQYAQRFEQIEIYAQRLESVWGEILDLKENVCKD